MKTETVKIQSGVPIPTWGISHYPFRHMKVGDSFWTKTQNPNKLRTICCNFASRNNGFRFLTRTEGKGIRVWRVPVNGKVK